MIIFSRVRLNPVKLASVNGVVRKDIAVSTLSYSFHRYKANGSENRNLNDIIIRNMSFFAPPNRNRRYRPSWTEQIKEKFRNGKLGTGIATAGIGASLLFGKTKYVLAALKLTKLAPLASMIISTGAYAMFFGLPYAVGMVGLIFVHELGHALAMKKYDIPFSPMVFIPFMGAAISMEEEPANSYVEAMVALAGPVVGSVGALSLSAIAQGMVGPVAPSTQQLLFALADWGYMINLFNLLPIGNLDGGRITGAISPWFGVAGAAAGGYMIYHDVVHNPLFYLIVLAGIYSSGKRLYGHYILKNMDKPWGYYNIGGARKTGIAALYVGLILGLLYAMKENNRRKKSPEQLKRERFGASGSSSAWMIEDIARDPEGMRTEIFPMWNLEKFEDDSGLGTESNSSEYFEKEYVDDDGVYHKESRGPNGYSKFSSRTFQFSNSSDSSDNEAMKRQNIDQNVQIAQIMKEFEDIERHLRGGRGRNYSAQSQEPRSSTSDRSNEGGKWV